MLQGDICTASVAGMLPGKGHLPDFSIHTAEYFFAFHIGYACPSSRPQLLV
jgi:hypothetical protein